MDRQKSEVDFEEVATVVLTDEFGENIEFEVLDLLEYEGSEYVVLLPMEQDEEEEGEVAILKVVVVDDEETLEVVEDMDLMEKIFEVFKERFESDYSFE